MEAMHVWEEKIMANRVKEKVTQKVAKDISLVGVVLERRQECIHLRMACQYVQVPLNTYSRILIGQTFLDVVRLFQ